MRKFYLAIMFLFVGVLVSLAHSTGWLFQSEGIEFRFEKEIGHGKLMNVYETGNPQPSGEVSEDKPNFTLRIDPKMKVEVDEEDFPLPNYLSLELTGVEDGQHIQIDHNGEKTYYTLNKDVANSIRLEVEPGDVIKVYADLTAFKAQASKLVACDLGKNEHLRVLDLMMNRITELDLSQLPNLLELAITGNNLTNMDLSKLSKLQQLYCSYNKLGKLDVRANPDLEVLACAGLGLKELDLSKNTKLENITAGTNAYTSIPDLGNKPSLKWIDMENCGIKEFDVSMFPKLKFLDLSGNQLTRIDLSKNPLLRKLDLDNNQLDACSINDILFTVPMANKEDNATLQIRGNVGSTTCDNLLLFGKNWAVNVIGDGTGCNTVCLRFEDNAQGSFKTLVDDLNVPEWTPIVKGKEVKIEATPIADYKFVKAMLDGKELTGNTFRISQYGVLAAVFEGTNGVRSTHAASVRVERYNGNIVVRGLQAEKSYVIYDVSGKVLASGLTDADGEISVSLPVGHVVIIKQGGILIKVMQ